MRTLVIDEALTIGIRLTNHFVNFLVREFLSYTEKDMINENAILYVALKQKKGEGERRNIPRLLMTTRKSAAEMRLVPDLSNTSNTFLISSSGLMSCILFAMIARYFSRVIVPSPPASTPRIMSCRSSSVGFWPSERITLPSSWVVITSSLSFRDT